MLSPIVVEVGVGVTDDVGPGVVLGVVLDAGTTVGTGPSDAVKVVAVALDGACGTVRTGTRLIGPDEGGALALPREPVVATASTLFGTGMLLPRTVVPVDVVSTVVEGLTDGVSTRPATAAGGRVVGEAAIM
jgi:hypothetical protein